MVQAVNPKESKAHQFNCASIDLQIIFLTLGNDLTRSALNKRLKEARGFLLSNYSVYLFIEIPLN